MREIDDRAYLTPPDNEAAALFICDFCDDYIYSGDVYYAFNGSKCCENCLRYLQNIAEPPDLEAEKADFEHHDIKNNKI